MAALRRRGWLVLLTVLLAALGGYLSARVRPPVSAAEALLLVPSGADEGSPGDAAEANRLALTLAGVLPEDDEVLGRTAEIAGTSVSAIQEGLTADVLSDTSLVLIRFESVDTTEALAVAEALADVVTQSPSVSETIPDGSLLVAREAEIADSGSSLGFITMSSGFLGLLIGLFLFALWERVDPRIDSTHHLERLVQVPVADLRGPTLVAVRSLIHRWRSVVADDRPVVLCVAADGKELVADLALAMERLDPSVAFHSAWFEGGFPSSRVHDAGLVVVGVPQGYKAGLLARQLQTLRDLGAHIGWCLLVPRRAHRRWRRALSEVAAPADGGPSGQRTTQAV